MIYTWRNPISIVFLVFLAAFQAFLQASIFGGVGAEKLSPKPKDRQMDVEILFNLIGLAFLTVSD